VVRTQVQLTQTQVQALRRVAASRGVSMATVIRDMLEQALVSPRSARMERARAIVGRFASEPAAASRDHDEELERAYQG
jgi:hypothetical protein